MKLGIIGHGFVGSAVDQGFTRDCKKFIVDPKRNRNSIEDLIKFDPEAIFVAVPTPQFRNRRSRCFYTDRCIGTIELW